MDEILLRRIAHHQMLHGSFSKNLGLLDGKMGIALFFFHYARYTGNVLYEDFGGEILDEIFEEIHDELLVRFRDGLCGIGWGIEYLVQKEFVEGNTDEILQEIDRKVMERDPRRIVDLSFETGLAGIACYLSSRLASPRQGEKPFDSVYIQDMKNAFPEFIQYSIGLYSEEILLKIVSTNMMKGERLSWKYGLKMLCT